MWQRLKLVRQSGPLEEARKKHSITHLIHYIFTRYIPEAFKGFFFAPVSPLPLACLRICISVVLLFQAFAIAPELGAFYGDQGVIQKNLSRYMGVHWAPKLTWFYGLLANNPFISFPVSFNAFVKGAFLLYLVAVTGLGLGWHTRFMAILSWVLHFTFMYSNSLANYGLDNFNHIILFYCTWMPITALSLDQASGRVHTRANTWSTVSLRLLQMHLCIIYFIAGFGKAKGEMWWNGEAIWRAIMLPEYRQFDFGWLAFYPWLAVLAAWSTLAIEGLYPLFIWPRKTRLFWVAATVGLHLGIALFQGLHLFASVMIILTGCAFGLNYELAKLRVPGKISMASMKAYRELRLKLVSTASTEKRPAPWLVLYDSDCGFCDFFVRFILKRDRWQRFYFTPLRSELAEKILPGPKKDRFKTIVLVGPEGIFDRSQAVLKIMQKLGRPWSQLILLNTIPIQILDIAYRLFATIRRLLNRFLLKKCRLLSGSETMRFIS